MLSRDTGCTRGRAAAAWTLVLARNRWLFTRFHRSVVPDRDTLFRKLPFIEPGKVSSRERCQKPGKVSGTVDRFGKAY
jgi:hypothetical protein